MLSDPSFSQSRRSEAGLGAQEARRSSIRATDGAAEIYLLTCGLPSCRLHPDGAVGLHR